MLNSIKADILRVLKKKSYMIMTSLVLVIYAVSLIISLSKSPESSGLITTLLSKAAMLMIGIPVFTAVFSDDFNSKAMQTIIGYGTSRRRLVISRYFEYLVILAQAFLAITLLCVALFGVKGQMAQIPEVLKDLWTQYLVTALSVNAAMIFVYGVQNATLGLVVFIGFIADVFGILFTGLNFIPFFMKHNIDLSVILPENIINEAINNGKPIYYLYAAIYIVIPLILSIKLFERKELEF